MAEPKSEGGAHERTWGASEEKKSTFAKRAGKSNETPDKETSKGSTK